MACSCVPRQYQISPRQARRISALQIFFEYAGCPTIGGQIPKCHGCENNERTPVGNTACTHPQHPDNIAAYREMAGRP